MRAMGMLGCLILFAGCSDSGEAPAPPLPTVEDVGGPRLARPQLVPIFFNEDSDIGALMTYSAWLVQSAWIREVGAEYGIGAGTVLPPVRLRGLAPRVITADTIVDLLFGGLADRSLPLPVTGSAGDTLYVAYFPAATVVTAGGATSCIDFGGYHGSARRNGIEIAYAVMPTCRSFDVDLTDLEAREVILSHEVIEAATDPYPRNHPAFQLRDPTSPWRAFGGEVGDLCTRGDSTGLWREGGFVAQRSWSNLAAAGGDPCVPVTASTPYFNLVVEDDTVLRIPPGGRAQRQLTGWSTGTTRDWALQTGTSPATLSLSATTLNAGQRTTLDVSVPATATVGTTIPFVVFSVLSPTRYQMLPMYAIVGDACSSFTDCEACSAHAGCGFCATTGRCEAQGRGGAAKSGCRASSFATWPGSCPGFCERYTSGCSECASQPGCGWCATGGAPHCLEASQSYSEPAAGSCAYADWSFTAAYCPVP
jgi:hypothetical protein